MKRLLTLLLFLLPAVSIPQSSNWVNLIVAGSATGPILQWPGGIGVFMCIGTWGGATVTFEFQGPDNATLIVAGTATTLTSNGAGVFYLPTSEVQAVVSGAGASTSLYCAAGIVNGIGPTT